jgi:hypothetical protein
MPANTASISFEDRILSPVLEASANPLAAEPYSLADLVCLFSQRVRLIGLGAPGLHGPSLCCSERSEGACMRGSFRQMLLASDQANG